MSPSPVTTFLIHIAGPMSEEGVQYCSRCGEMLVDYRGAMVMNGSSPLTGYREGVYIGTSQSCSVVLDRDACEIDEVRCGGLRQ